MKAELYLSSLHQDLIDSNKIINVEMFEKISPSFPENAWTLCCDGFCCIADFSKFQNPIDLISRKRPTFSWYLREEKFGGLLWNPDTNRVYQLDREAYEVLMTLQEGGEFGKVVQKHGIEASELFMLLAEISKKVERKSDKK